MEARPTKWLPSGVRRVTSRAEDNKNHSCPSILPLLFNTSRVLNDPHLITLFKKIKKEISNNDKL